MNDQQLHRALQSIGKEVFVDYFCKFADMSLSPEYVARILEEEKGYNKEASRRIRVSNARRIIKAGRAKDALIIISKSQVLPARIAERASKLAMTL